MNRGRHIRDSLLVLRCQQGDGDAFAALVEGWQERLWRHACRLTGNEEAAADVVQDSWLAVIKGIVRLHDADAFPGWVFRIVTNKSRDWVRKQQRRRLLHAWLKRDAVRLNMAQAPNARLDSLHAALECLSVNQRALVTLYYEEGFSIQEIADIVGIAQGTVKSRLYHARMKIRSHMEDAINE